MQAVRMAPRRPEAVFELLLDARVHERDPHRAEVEARSVLSRLEGAHRVAVPPQAVQRLALLRSVVPRADAVRPPVGIELPIVPKASVGHAEPRIERPHDLGEVEEFGRLQRHRLDAKVPLQIVERPPFALHRARVEHVDKVPREHSEDLETQRQPEVDVQILLQSRRQSILVSTPRGRCAKGAHTRSCVRVPVCAARGAPGALGRRGWKGRPANGTRGCESPRSKPATLTTLSQQWPPAARDRQPHPPAARRRTSGPPAMFGEGTRETGAC
eukprot:4780260-Prymnesium_polylepis.1